MSFKVRFNQMLRLSKQWFLPTRVAIIGGYHGGNLGDIALGLSVKEVFDLNNITSGLQTIYTLDKLPWKKIDYGVIGGGSVGYIDSLQRVSLRYKSNFKNISLLGVDYPLDDYSDESVMELLTSASILSCRSNEQGVKLSSITNRKDVSIHPDLAYSYQKKLCKKMRNDKKEKILLINVVPLYGNFKNGRLEPIDNYRDERPELYENYDLMVTTYKNEIREIAKRHIEEGYKIESIPFTPGDKLMAEFILEGTRTLR
eukprot:TRINITY_DN2108_c0_g1_i1.p1 TRINITY_DN2108_c0_g1~~TRINITY_DN2108_c0_g1_i1.p1  ORF type:complete len:257 (-),score=50.43 TRINITY_DN2108_c0_g1_i1:3-773(-)